MFFEVSADLLLEKDTEANDRVLAATQLWPQVRGQGLENFGEYESWPMERQSI